MDLPLPQPPTRSLGQRESRPKPGVHLAGWLRAHLPELLFAALLLAVLPMRDLWAPDEPDFAQCVKDMRLRGDWLLPYLNGVPYSEKPILYYWVMKASSVLFDTLTGGFGFTQGVAAWALRLPSMVAAVAFLVPFLFLNAVQSKQGKYLLMAYPFLALLLAGLFRHAGPSSRARRLGGLLVGGLALPAAALAALALGAGGAKFQAQIAPFLGPVRLMALAMGCGLLLVLVKVIRGNATRLVPATALALGLLYLVGGTWGFRLLDPQKNYRRWTAAVQPMIQGRQVFYWQTIRSGVMVYTDHLMPELRDPEALERMDPEARLVAQHGEWEQDASGLTPALRTRFEVVLAVPTGGGETLLLKKKKPA